MSVRAKFTVSEVTTYNWSDTVRRVMLRPIYDPSIPEDRRFALATPSGEFWMQIDNPSASNQLTPGKVFYIDLTEVPRS